MPEPYQKVVFVGYSIDTAPEGEKPKQSYLGLEQPCDDIRTRVEVMSQAMTRVIAD